MTTNNFAGVIRRDVAMINIGNTETFGENVVNFEKLALLWEVLKPVEFYQKHPYNFEKHSVLHAALSNLAPVDENTLYKYSIEFEPSESIALDG
jgi:hypothetical protein